MRSVIYPIVSRNGEQRVARGSVFLQGIMHLSLSVYVGCGGDFSVGVM